MRKWCPLGLLLLLLVGCGPKNQAGEGGREAVIDGKGTVEWIADLKSGDDVTRKKAIRILSDKGKKDGTVRFDLLETVKGTNGDDKNMRIGAAEALGLIGWDADEAFPHLKVMLPKEQDDDVARAVAQAMARIDEKEAAKLGIHTSSVNPKKK